MVESDNLRDTRIALNNGSGAIPALGFGTLIPDPIATKTATKAVLEAGFRLLDAAERYRTETEVGEAMQEVFKRGRSSGSDVFVATKLWNTNHRPDRVKPVLEASLKKLQLDYADLYLIHTPYAFQPGDEQDPRHANGNVIYDKTVTLLDTWRAIFDAAVVDPAVLGSASSTPPSSTPPSSTPPSSTPSTSDSSASDPGTTSPAAPSP